MGGYPVLGSSSPTSAHPVNDTPDNPGGSAGPPETSAEDREQSRPATVPRIGAVVRSNSVAGHGDSNQRSAGRFGIDGVSSFMGMCWDRADIVRLEIRPELINAGGLLSGVVTYALVDYCMGSTLWPHTKEDEHIATLNISINYIQTATEGEIVCKTELDRRNRTNAVLRSDVRHEDGRLLVSAIGSYAIFPARKRSRVP
jgi:1,4-dihydroxy-2-naphthoyl-CoA hydrolase